MSCGKVQMRDAENPCVQKKEDCKWQEFKIKTLGVWLSTELEFTMNLNLKKKAGKVHNIPKN